MRPAMQLQTQLPRSGIVVHGYLCASQQASIADKGQQHKEHGITKHTTGCRNVLVVVLCIVLGIVFFPVYTVPSERTLFVHDGNGKLVRYFSRTTHWLFLVFCAYMLVYVHVSMYSADAMPSSVVPPQLLHICLNVMSLLPHLVANSWLEFAAGHCEAPQRHSRNLSIPNVSYHAPDKTSSTRSRSQRVPKAHAVSPV